MSLFGSLFEEVFPIALIVKVIIILVIGLVTILGAYFVPKGKIFVIAGGIIAILVIWFIELEISL